MKTIYIFELIFNYNLLHFIKEYGYITLDEAGELILKPECAEKAKEILRQEERVNDKHTPCYSTNPPLTDDGTNNET